MENFDFVNAEAQFVKITGYGNSSSLWNSITEIRINIASNDATLSSLSVNTGTLSPEFNSSDTVYSVLVPFGTTSVTIEAVTNDENASVTGDSIVDVSSGSGMATIVVTAEDAKTTKTYTINITVEGNSGFIITAMQKDFVPRVFPNPSSNVFSVQAKGSFTYELFDITGASLTSGIAIENCTIASETAPGIYFLKINQGTDSKIYRLIKL